MIGCVKCVKPKTFEVVLHGQPPHAAVTSDPSRTIAAITAMPPRAAAAASSPLQSTLGLRGHITASLGFSALLLMEALDLVRPLARSSTANIPNILSSPLLRPSMLACTCDVCIDGGGGWPISDQRKGVCVSLVLARGFQNVKL